MWMKSGILTIRQEVMLEMRADILGKIMEADKDFNIERRDGLWPVLYAVIWNTKKPLFLQRNHWNWRKFKESLIWNRNLISKLGQTD